MLFITAPAIFITLRILNHTGVSAALRGVFRKTCRSRADGLFLRSPLIGVPFGFSLLKFRISSPRMRIAARLAVADDHLWRFFVLAPWFGQHVPDLLKQLRWAVWLGKNIKSFQRFPVLQA
jgi:hypothetical protein